MYDGLLRKTIGVPAAGKNDGIWSELRHSPYCGEIKVIEFRYVM
jgi:hypothetical protein